MENCLGKREIAEKRLKMVTLAIRALSEQIATEKGIRAEMREGLRLLSKEQSQLQQFLAEEKKVAA